MANGKNLASGVGLQFSPTVLGAIEQVCELWRSDVGRRDFLSGSAGRRPPRSSSPAGTG